MLKRLFAAVGKARSTLDAAEPTGLHAPYAQPHLNYLYNLLFCDDIALFKSRHSKHDSSLWQSLLAEHPDQATLTTIANDENNEGRVRALAYLRLRRMGATPPAKRLLGVIVEVPLELGLDVLAAFSDGGVRYLNQSGKVAVLEGENHPAARMARDWIAAAQSIVDNIGPWEDQRLPPPKPGNVRISFLVSDGLYFGEGPFSVLEKDAMAGPVLSKGAQLLQQVTALATK